MLKSVLYSDDNVMNQSKPKIFFTGNSAWGMFRFRAALLRDCVERNLDVTVLAPEDDYATCIRQLGCSFLAYPMSRRGMNPVKEVITFLHFFRIYKFHRPSIVFHYTVKPIIWGSLAANLLRIPNIAVITGLGFVFMKNSALTRIVSHLYKIALFRTREVWFLNHEDLAEFSRRKIIETDRMFVLPGEGLDLGEFPRATKFPETPTFLLVARLLWDKGIAEYIEAAKWAKIHFPDARFQLLGPFDSGNPSAVGKDVITKCHQDGLIEYLGVTDDVRSFIANATCIVLPSYREGLPRALLEAAAMARPIITTDCPGCRDIVADGKNGYLVPVRDQAALCDAISKIAKLRTEELRNLGENGRKLVETKYSISNVLAEYRSRTADLPRAT